MYAVCSGRSVFVVIHLWSVFVIFVKAANLITFGNTATLRVPQIQIPCCWEAHMGTDAWLGTQLETNKTCMVDVPEFDMNSLNMSKHVYLNFKPMFDRERSNHQGTALSFRCRLFPQRERCGTLSKVKTAKSHGLWRIVID